MLETAVRRIAAELPDDSLVLDVGGWAKPLSRADWVLDLLPYETRGMYGPDRDDPERFTAHTWVTRDICAREPWPFADDQFDFAVCAHTLEDVRDPVWVCQELGRVARAGYIEVPAPVEELTWGVQGEWVGWGHHHWICERDPAGLVFTFKPHLLCASGRHLPPGTTHGLPADELVLTLWWDGAPAVREQVFVGADEFDPWLAGLLEHCRRPVRAPRGLRRLLGR
jgi:methyltransferase family protein